jgi:uncharacterized protein YabN with tetrapyrrole methylase and pyrophosphatase domain
MSNLESCREILIKKIKELLDNNNISDSEVLSKNIEKGIYNTTIKYAEVKGILKRWDNKHFKNIYVVKGMSPSINPENALEKTNKRFINRFQIMERLIKSKNLDLSEMKLKEMDDFWEKARFFDLINLSII